MQIIESGFGRAYLDFFLSGPVGETLVLSFFGRSMQEIRSVGAHLVLEGEFYYRNRRYSNPAKFKVFYSTITRGKEKLSHGIAVATDIKKEYLINVRERLYSNLYSFLMTRFNLPLLEWWMPEIYQAMVKRYYIGTSSQAGLIGNRERTIRLHSEEFRLDELEIYRIAINEEQLKNIVSGLLKKKRIWITQTPQKPLKFTNMDEYFMFYGSSIVDNLTKILKPISELNGAMDRMCLKSMRLYPQQIAMVNGIYEYFRKTKSKYAIFSMEMGTGKTIQAASAAEMLFVGKWLEQNPKKTLSDAYEHDETINYRHIVMCPPHLVKKWRKELVKEIPYAKPVIIEDFRQLVQLRDRGISRDNGKEFYIMSYDFAKLSYQMIPVPKHESTRHVEVFECRDCHSLLNKRHERCPFCESTNIRIKKTRYKRSGLICPFCNRLLYPANKSLDFETLADSEDLSNEPMHWYDMIYETTSNQRCGYCDEALWKPFVRNISSEMKESKEAPWQRITYWKNRAKKGKVTYWILKGQEEEARKLFGESLNEVDRTGGCRKYSPARFIKKYMKGYFDVFIADEVHKAKGGSTAQGNAFHSLVKSSRYTFGLTGTIAGGMATDLYYMLFRLEPGRMIQHGYQWGSVMKFAKDYGSIAQEFGVIRDCGRINTLSRGKQLQAPRVVPGISPTIFSDFLLDRAVFLNLVDMSSHMPPLHEKILLCSPQTELEEDMKREYDRVLRLLKEYSRNHKVNLDAVRNQFSMSYLDKPYEADPIIDPKNGNQIITPGDYSRLTMNSGLLAKEEKLLDLISGELKEGRNCVVYVEFSATESTNVLPRLREIIREHLGLEENEVVILKSGIPKATDREKWMHMKAREGMRVMLCNPRLCETGLDFCWSEDEILYNFPTLIFYQCGYSLYVTWQASGRAWRLNQKEECRTYYLAYAYTVQQAILQVLGEKKAATAAISGKFSADGLSAMAKGVDVQVRIAQIMSEMDTTSGNRLQEMFDVRSAAEEEDIYKNIQPMKLFAELVAKERQLIETNSFAETENLFAVFQQFLEPVITSYVPQEMVTEENRFQLEFFSFFNDSYEKFDQKSHVIEEQKRNKKRKKKDKYEAYGLEW